MTNMDVPHLKETVDFEDSRKGAYQIAKHIQPNWEWEDVQFRNFTGGITNHLIGVYSRNNPDDMVLVRINGLSSETFIDRNKELETFKLLHNRGYAPQLYLTFENGMAFEYLPGVTLNRELCYNAVVSKLVPRMMAKIHKINWHENDSPIEPQLWDMLERFIELIPEKFSNPENEARFRHCCPDGKDGFKKELKYLRKALHSVGNPVVFCHNDVILPNVIYIEKKESVTFIDYEYAGYNYQAYDLAMHFTSFADEGGFENPLYPSEAYQLEWIREYLKEFQNSQTVNEDDVQQLYKHTCQFETAVNFLCAVWNFMQVDFSVIDFDYLKFASDKYGEYKKSLRYIHP